MHHRSLRHKQPASISVLIVAALAVGALAGACGSDDPIGPDPGEPVERHFTFDTNMEGWQAAATDTLDPPIDWHVTHTSDRGHPDDGSIELHLENLNDAGKIWMERDFNLAPGVTYDVSVRYALGTSDWGFVNLFTLITGVHAAPPRQAADLTFQGDTGHGGDADIGVVWLERTYDLSITAPPDGTVYVVIGVWGTWETARTYFVDDVRVRFDPVAG